MEIGLRVDDAADRRAARDLVKKVMENALPGIILPDLLEGISLDRRPADHVRIEWRGNIEGKVLGKPDLLRLRAFATHAEVDGNFVGLRIDYSR